MGSTSRLTSTADLLQFPFLHSSLRVNCGGIDLINLFQIFTLSSVVYTMPEIDVAVLFNRCYNPLFGSNHLL